MSVSLLLEILPGFQPQNLAAKKMVRHKILSRTSTAAKGRDLVSEKVLIDKLVVYKKMLRDKFLVSEVILNNNFCVWVCPQVQY